MKPQEQIAAFEAHAKAVYKDFKRDITILKPLFEHLDRQQKEKPEKLTKEKLEGLLIEDPKNPQKGKGQEREAGCLRLRLRSELLSGSGGPPRPTSGGEPCVDADIVRPSRRT